MLLIFSFCISALIALVIIYTNHIHQTITTDQDHGIQKVHQKPTSRIGGLAIFISMTITSLLATNLRLEWSYYFCGIIVVSSVVFIGGLTEDITKRVSPLGRATFMSIGAILAVYLTHTIQPIHQFNNILLNNIFADPFASIIITLFATIGLPNAYNMIDGFNGISSMYALASTIALLIISNYVGDYETFKISLVFIGALLGFIVFNYPNARIFLGDGGAYVVGFMMCLLGLNLIQDNESTLSLWLFLLLQIYPITEVAFTIFRRKIIHKTSATQPDRLHLHHLIHDKLVHKNYRVMPILLILFMLPQILFSLVFYNNYLYLIFAIIAYIIYYATMYTLLYNYKKNKTHG